MRRGAEVAAVTLAVLAAGFVGPAALPAAAQAADGPDLGAQIDQVAGELAGLDTRVAELQAARDQLDTAIAAAEDDAEAIREEATDREELRASLIAQARAYALQRYMYGSASSRDLLAFLSALAKPADDAVWGLATLEVTSEAALDEAQQVAAARAAIEDRLAEAESDVLVLRATRGRKDQELQEATAQRAEAAGRFETVVRELGQATVNGMSTVAYNAYQQAEATVAAEQPACGLRWELLAAIGKTESNHGIGRLDVFGNSQIAIIGIPIGGDTDGGALDGDPARDHAVGPMQFIPSTWKRWGTDANGDGRSDPGNIVDAATAAGRYLCRAAGDLTLGTEAGVIRAILSYNPNQTYLRVVGARFEALASDLAAGWFSAASLPPAPAPVADIEANAGPDGRTGAGGAPPPAPPPPPTTVTEVRIFGPDDLASSTTAPVTIPDGTCLGPSLVLDGRAGFLRCQPRRGDVVDPCEVAPYDATLVGCLPDPTGAPVLLRLEAPATDGAAALAGAPPYRLLVLDGGDRCLPVPAPEPVTPPAPAPPPKGGGRAPTATTTTTTTTAVGPAGSNPSTTATATTGAATTAAPTTSRPAPAAATTTAGPTSPTSPTTTTVPIEQRPTYGCASGATVIGLADTSAAAWTVTVRQDGLADRRVLVAQAFS